MNILNMICFGSAFVCTAILFVFTLLVFCTSVYGCFTKKLAGNLLAKLLIVVVSASTLPWIVKLLIFLFFKMVA